MGCEAGSEKGREKGCEKGCEKGRARRGGRERRGARWVKNENDSGGGARAIESATKHITEATRRPRFTSLLWIDAILKHGARGDRAAVVWVVVGVVRSTCTSMKRYETV